jgi:hypothetical protein
MRKAKDFAPFRILFDQTNPRQFLLGKDVFAWREILRVVQASGRDVNLARPRVPLISQGGSAKFAESPPRSRIGAVSLWCSLFKCKCRAWDSNPGNGLGTGGSPTVGAVAIGLENWLLRRSVAYLAAVTAAGDGCLFHANAQIRMSAMV